MGYDILSNDLYDSETKIREDKSKTTTKKSKKPSSLNIKGLLIHLTILIVVFGLAYLYFNGFFKHENIDTKETIEIIGEIDNFQKQYSGNIIVEGKTFQLLIPNGNITQGATSFEIEDFIGTLTFANKSLTTKGTAKIIHYGKNTINLNGQEFELQLKNKFKTNLFLPEYKESFTKGSLIFNGNLNYKFQNSSITVKNFNMNMVYDGKFSITGTADELKFDSPKNNLEIIYKDILSQQTQNSTNTTK